jgi:hypothetical protein
LYSKENKKNNYTQGPELFPMFRKDAMDENGKDEEEG